MTAPMPRAEVLALGPVIDLVTLGRALGVSEPTIREQARTGHLDAIGIKVVALGAQRRVVTASLWAFLGLDPAADGASDEAGPRRAARRRHPAASVVRLADGDGAG
jgi:hypothetical protein